MGQAGADGLSVKQNMLWNMAGSITNLVCQYLITVLVVRLSTGLNSAGIYSLAVSVFAMFSPIANYGMYSYLVTDVRNENTLGEYLTVVCGTSVICFCLVVAYTLLTCRPNAWAVIALYAVYKTIAIFIDILHAYDQKRHRMDCIGISLAAQGTVSLVVFGAVFFWTHSLTATILAMTVGMLAIGALYDVPATLKLTTIKLGISKKIALHLLKSCLPIVVANAAYGAVPSIPRQYLSTICGDATLGIYASVAAPVAIIQTGATYIYNPLITYFAEHFTNRNRKAFASLLAKTLLGIAGIGILAVGGIYVLAYPVLNLLYGSTVASYSALMYPLVGSSLLMGVQGFFNNLLVAMRSFRSMVVSSLVSLAAAIVVCVPLVSTFTMNGVTYALAVSCATGLVFSSCCIRMRLNNECPKTPA